MLARLSGVVGTRNWSARRCSSVAALALGLRSAMRFRCGVLHLVHVRYTVLLRRFVFDHACCLPPVRQTGRLAGCCVSIPPGRDRHSCVLVMLARLSALAGSLRVWTFFYGDLDGITGDAGNGGLAARPLCSFAQPHWLCCAFRGEYAGAARPRLRQRVFDSLDSLHAAAGLCWCKYSSLQKAQVPNQRTHARKTRVHGKT